MHLLILPAMIIKLQQTKTTWKGDLIRTDDWHYAKTDERKTSKITLLLMLLTMVSRCKQNFKNHAFVDVVNDGFQRVR